MGSSVTWDRLYISNRETLAQLWISYISFTSALYFIISLNEKLSEVIEEDKMMKFRWRCEMVEIDKKKYKDTLGEAWNGSAAINQKQVYGLQCHFSHKNRLHHIILTLQFGEHSNVNSRIVGSNPTCDWLIFLQKKNFSPVKNIIQYRSKTLTRSKHF